ncbi:MAG: pyridoxal phosphate-dependent aminotransferase [Deltaproteobacteria bacterium]|nr:pyridoxal phosphate-dependent aminotransferase [Deltaproteobacteria bacterium]
MKLEDKISPSFKNIRMSPIVTISELVKKKAPEFKAKTGRDFVCWQRGEVDFPTPAYIKTAALEALEANKTKYPISGGEPKPKEAILKRLERVYGARGLDADHIVITFAAQEALELSFGLFRGKKGAGFAPCWSCALENFIPYAEIDFTEVPLKKDFSIDYDILKKILDEPGMSLFYLNTPHNPTGKVFSKAEITRVAEMCKEREVCLISDEAYETIVYDGQKHFSASSIDLDNIISTFTLSKSYSMTGWRLGYAVTRNKEIARLLKLGNYTQTAGVYTFGQYALEQAISNVHEEQKAVSAMVAGFARRREVLYAGLSRINGLTIDKPGGAFYMFPNFSNLIPKNLTGEERNKFIFNRLMNVGVATVYGSCFGRHFGDNVRVSFSTTPVPVIEDGIARVTEALKGLG